MTSLGGQTVRTFTRTRGKHNTYTETPGPVFAGCSVQPDSSGDRNEDGTAVETRWKIFAPPGFPERHDGVMTVDGLVDSSGRPRRLHVFGVLQTWTDLDGQPSHVEGILVDAEG